MTSPIFNAEEMEQFLDWGFVKASGVFPRHIAVECRRMIDEQLKNQMISLADHNTWPKRIGLTNIFYENEGYPWNQVFTERLRDAVDMLCGKGRWDSFGCGWWVISFPSSTSSSDFEVEGHWHIDGSSFVHFPHSKEIGLVLIMLFSDILPNGGGTAVACGSHKAISRLIIESGTRGMTSKEVVSQVPMDFEVVELSGQCGDVILMHPHLLHARSRNNGPMEASAIRYICHPTIALKQPMNFDQPVQDMSLVERSIWDEAREHHLDLVRYEDCMTCNPSDDSVDRMDVESSMGIKCFGSRKRPRR